MHTPLWIIKLFQLLKSVFKDVLSALIDAQRFRKTVPSSHKTDEATSTKEFGENGLSSETLEYTTNDDVAICVIRLLECYSPPNASQIRVESRAFEEAVRTAVNNERPLTLVLPAFPFKSPNRMDKVLGALPDLGEETALLRLEGLCADIDKLYPGTSLLIVSDGIIYSDILGVTEQDVWRYGRALREFAKENCPHIKFTSLARLLSVDFIEPTTMEEYVQKAPYFREQVIENHLPADFDVDKELREKNWLSTYCGYIKFLEADMKYHPDYIGLTKSQIKKRNQVVAKKMILRGKAFSNAIQNAYPTAVRISIHASNSQHKLPINILPGKHNLTTPWHSSCAVELDGSMIFAHSSTFTNNPNYELAHLDGRPSHFRPKSDLYQLASAEVDIRPIYPCGLMVTPRTKCHMEDIDMKKVRALAELNSPIVLRGFVNPKDVEQMQVVAKTMGTIMPWKFGNVLMVRDAGAESGGLNNVLSAEPMPFHYDGTFKTAETTCEDGVKRLLPQPPRFQFFSAVTPSPKDTGLTLFSSSKNVFEHLPKPWTAEALSKLTISIWTSAFEATKLTGLKLVESHPTHSAPCLRYHELWPSTKTKFDATYVAIENGPPEVVGMLDTLLYDRRVCYYHAWNDGDLLVSDNISMMHTRSEFTAGVPRELWRIHIN